MEGRIPLRQAALLLLLSLPLFLVGLGAADLDLKGEPREAITARAMLRGGDWLLPRLNDEAIPEKPLLFPWCVAGSMLLFGGAEEWMIRLPAALAAAGSVLLVWLLGRRLLPDPGGLLAGCLFGGSLLAVTLGRSARVDMLLTFFVAASVLLALHLLGPPGEEAPRRRWTTAALFWITLAGGTLAKGPLGAVLPVLAVGAILLVQQRPRDGWRLRPWPWAGLFLVVAGTWYFLGALREGMAFVSWAILQENFRMFTGISTIHAHGPLYYLPRIFLVTLPWGVFLPLALVSGFRGEKGAWRRESFLVPLLWLGTSMLLFSAGSAKRIDYLLPLLPPAALLTARWLLERDAAKNVSRWHVAAAGLLAALGAVLAAVAAGLALEGTRERLVEASSRWVAPEAARAWADIAAARPWALAFGAAMALAAGGLPLLFALRRRPVRGQILATFCLAGTVAAASVTVIPAGEGATSLRPFAEEMGRVVPADGALTRFPKAAYRFQIGFYADRDIPPMEEGEFDAFLAAPEGRYVLTTADWFDTLPRERLARVTVLADGARPGGRPNQSFLLLGPR